MTTLLLIRHATNDMVGKRLAGWLPGVHLNEEGKQQAAALAERLAGVPLHAVYSSPLERALETARAIAAPRGLPVHVRDELGEVRYGAWEGRSLEELKKTDLWPLVQRFPSRVRFPDGEALYEVQCRVVTAVERILAAHPNEHDVVAVVAHADVIRLAVAFYVGLPLDLYQRLVVAPASVSVLHVGKEGPRLWRWNDTGAIEWPQPDSSQQREGVEE